MMALAAKIGNGPSQSVESVMAASSSRLWFPRQTAAVDKTKDPKFWAEWEAKLAALEAKRESQYPANWLAGRQVAILLIERSPKAMECLARLDRSTARASQSDFAWLREQGYATRNLGDRYHRLTADGIRAAEQVAKAIAKRLGLHHISYGNTDNSASAKCACGFFASFDRKWGNESSQLRRAVDQHLADPEEWKRINERTQARIATMFGGGDG